MERQHLFSGGIRKAIVRGGIVGPKNVVGITLSRPPIDHVGWRQDATDRVGQLREHGQKRRGADRGAAHIADRDRIPSGIRELNAGDRIIRGGGAGDVGLVEHPLEMQRADTGCSDAERRRCAQRHRQALRRSDDRRRIGAVADDNSNQHLVGSAVEYVSIHITRDAGNRRVVGVLPDFPGGPRGGRAGSAGLRIRAGGPFGYPWYPIGYGSVQPGVGKGA